MAKHERALVIADAGLQLPALTSKAVLGTDSSGNIILGTGSSAVGVPIGFIDIIGHSGIADGQGVTQPDYGPAHKIDQFLQPAMYNSCAMGGAICCQHNLGNGTSGDGGWAQVATAFDRQELITGFTQTTLGGTTFPVGSTSLTISVAGGIPNEWITVGSGANTEVVQIAGTYAGGSTTIPLAAPTTKSHVATDPVYHASRNSGLKARSALVLLDIGGNDVPTLGPGAAPGTLSSTWQSGTFGTNPGASRGLTPFMHSYRFIIALMRSAVVYKDTHTNVQYQASVWNQFGITSFAANPQTYSFGGGNNGSYHYTTTAGSTITFATDPDFPGGTVNMFNFSFHDGGGAVWDYSVSGATTVAMTSHTAGTLWDDRNINCVTQNDAAALTTGATTGSVKRITGLNPGVNVITVKATTVNLYGIFLGWGIEAPTPPLVLAAQQYRLGGYQAGFGYGLWDVLPKGYIRRAPQTTQTATVSAGAGTAVGSVTLGTAVTVGAATVTGPTAVYQNDTITVWNPASPTTTMETRRIVGVDSTTTLHVDAAFTQAHAGHSCIIGYQDADFVGGGYINTADTQGKTSVPGLNGAIASVAAEFDQYVQVTPFDTFVSAGPGVMTPAIGANPNLANDGVHMSDSGGGDVAFDTISLLGGLAVPTLRDVSGYLNPNKRFPLRVYGDSYPTLQPAPGSGALSQFVNGWTNYYPMGDGSDLVTSWYKDARTREVVLEGCITNYTGIREDQLPSRCFTIPFGYIPKGTSLIEAYTSMGPASMEARPDGWVYVTSGFWVLTAPPPTSGGAKLMFHAKWYPQA